MDWLTFKFCVLIWVLCVSISKSQSQLLNSTSSISSQLRSDCEDGQPVVPPNQCNSCICFAGQIYCTNMPCPEQDCVSGVDLPQPDACNKCICRRGKVTCTNMICIPAPHCAEKQLYPAQNKCNACMCLSGFITCTSNPCAEELFPSTIPTTATKKPKKKKKCIEGDSLPGPNECIKCFCQDGRKRCKFICNPTVESRFGEGPECVPGQHIPRPDDCNNCICFEGQIHCTHLPCRMDTRIGPECTDNQPVYRPDECNECYCFEGRLECSDLVCIRGSKCVQGQVIPKPDSCNACKCVEGHILCTDYQCPVLNSRNALRSARSSTEVKAMDECQEGDIISPPPPPNDCNTCYCMDNRILCTMINCEGSDPEIKGRLRDPNGQTDLEIFDKKISVEPFIDMLSKNHEKLPAKLIHTHAYNGFHQEIKVHASHLPKDATKLLKILATTLDNSALASISQSLLSSTNSLPNNRDTKLPLHHQVVQTNITGEGNVLTTQSSKLITSGSQSNETILVIPNTDDVQYSQSVLPLTSKHESIWKSVSSPATLIFHNNKQINPGQEEKLNVYYYDNPPSMFTPIDQNNVIRNPSKFSRPGLTHMLPTKPTRNTEKTITNNVNDGKMSYAPTSQDNKQIKPVPSGFVSKHDEWPHLRPYQPTLPGPTQVFNYTSSTPVFRPAKFVIPNNSDGQQKPSQSQFIPNLSKYYANQVKPQQFLFKPNQNHLPTLNNMGIQHPLLFPNNLNQPIVAPNQYKQPQFELKPGQGSVNPLNNIGNQTYQQFKVFPPIFQINPPLIHIPNQKKRISSINDGSKEALPHAMVPNSAAHHANILNPPQLGVDPENPHHKPSHSQLDPNPSIIYRNEYEEPKIIGVNPDQEQFMPHSKISYMDPEHYNPPHTSSELDHDTLIPKVCNRTRKYNTTHSHYEKHTSVTYVSEYDPTHPANPHEIVHDLNQHQNAPQTNVNEYDLPDQESKELDLIMSKVNYYLNLPSLQLDQNVEPHPKLTYYYSSQTTVFPGQQQNYPRQVHPTISEMNKYNQHDSENTTNHQFDTYPHSPSDGEHADQIKTYENRTNPAINIFDNYPHSSSQSQLPSQDYYKKEGLFGTQSLSDSDEEPTHPKSIEHLPSPSETGPSQNQHPPGVIDDWGSTNGFKYAHNAYEDPRQLKPVHKLFPSKLETPQHHQLPGFLDERGSADGFQYPFLSAEDLTHPKVELNKSPHFDPYILISNPEQAKDNPLISPHSQFETAQNQYKPGLFDNRGNKDGFQYAHNADRNPTHQKPMHKLLPFTHSHTPFDLNLIQHSPGMFDERVSADGFQYPSHSAETPIQSRGNLHNPKPSQFGPTQNQHLPGIFAERESAEGFQYPPTSAEKPLHPKEIIQKPNSPFGFTAHKQLPHSQVGPNHNKPIPGMFDGRGSRDGYQYSSNSPQNPLHQKDNLHYPSHSQFGSPQNQHLPGVVHNYGSPGSFPYPSNSAKNRTNSKDNLNILPHSQFVPNQKQHKQIIHSKQPNSPIGPTQNQNLPGMFDERGPKPKDNQHNDPHNQFGPTLNQHTPGEFDERDSVDGFQYPSNSAENPRHPKQIKQIQPNSPFDPTQNQPLPGMFDERGSADGFQYPSNSAENPRHPKQNKQIQSNSPFDPIQNQPLPGMFDERGSANGFQYPSNSVENPTNPKNNLYKHPQSQFVPSPYKHTPGVFDDRGSADGFQYPSNTAENPTNPKNNLHKHPQSQFVPSPYKHTPGVFDDRGSADGFQYPSNSAENPTNPKNNLHKHPQSQFVPSPYKHTPGVFDDSGSADGFQYPSNSAENPTHPKDNLHKHPQSQFLPSLNQHTPGVFDDRGSADGFQYPSNSAENARHPKQNNHQPKSPIDPTQNQHLPGMFDERGSADGFQYPSNSVENPAHPKDNLHKLPHSQFLPSSNQHTPGVFDERGSADGFQYPSNSAENARHPKQNNHQPKSPIDPTQNQHLPGMFDERGSADGFQYPSNSVENPAHPKDNLHKLPQSQFLPSSNQHTPGVFDDRGSADGFQYPSNSAENARHPKQNNHQPKSPIDPAQNQHLPGMFDERGSADGFQYPSNSVENPVHPKDNLHKHPQSQFLPSLNQHTPGVLDHHGSADGFQYPSNSAENPRHPKQNKQTQHKSPFDPIQNQSLPGMFDERGSADDFQYPSNSVENPTHPKNNLHKHPQSQFLPSLNQHTPGVLHDHGSADGFQYPSNSAENARHPKQNNHQPKSPFDPTQNQHLPGMFDERGSADGFQYPSNSVENPAHPKENLHKLPQSQFLPSSNQHTPGVFDDRGSADGFQYPSNSAENARHPKQNNHQPKSPIDPAQNQHLPGMFDERGSADGFQYPSNSVENPAHPKENLHKLPQSQFLPSSNQHTPGVFDDRGSADGFQYPSNSAENARHPKQNNHQPKSPIDPAQNQHLPGMFDERGSADGFQYPSNSVENPAHPKENLHKLPQSQFLPSSNQHTPGVFDDRGSADGFQYPSNSAENARHPKDNLHKHPQSQFLPSPNQHTPGVFDDRGSADSFQYPSNSAENRKHPKQNNYIQPKSPINPTQNQHIPGMFDERGSSDGFQYPSNSVENPRHPKENLHKLPQSQFLPSPNQHTPGVINDRGSADGFHYPSNSAEDSTHPKNKSNTTPESKFKLPQNQPKPSSLDDIYNNNNPLRPWMHLDHDQYKPSSFDNLLNGVHNIPWSFSGDQNKDSDTVTQAPNPRLKPDFDQYKPSSFDKLFNGIHQTPWSVPNQDNNALGFDAEITSPRSGFNPKQGQNGPSMFDDPSKSNKNEITDFTDVDDNQLQIDQDVSTPSTDHTDSVSPQYNLLPKLKPDSDPDSLFLTDDGKIPDYYDQLYPLFKAVKKLSDPPIDDSLYSVGSMDQLDLLPFLFPGIAKMLNYKPSQDRDDVSPVQNHDAQRINPLSKLKSKLEQLPENDNSILNWLKSKFNKLVPSKQNATVTKNEVDITKIFNLLSKLTPPNLKNNAALHNVPFSGFDPEIIENIMNDFEEDTVTTTSTPRTDSTHSYGNRFRSDPTVPEESQPQAGQLKYPDVHIILHQPNDEDDVDVPPYLETDGKINLATDMNSEELSDSIFPKMFNPRFRHRPKDQKEECGDGTQWISNCHGCSCYFGEAMCYKLPDCELRPLGEPMTCKPYSHFEMGCYTCECNGDGVAECDATDCNTQPSRKSKVSDSTETPLPIFNSKKTKEILQYYNNSEKLPKDCPKQDLQTQYPTCERGTSWVSSCHKCECNDSGKHECIKIDDCELDVDSYGKPARCKPNSKFYPKTNSMPCVECSCNDEGTSYCPTVDYKKH